VVGVFTHAPTFTLSPRVGCGRPIPSRLTQARGAVVLTRSPSHLLTECHSGVGVSVKCQCQG
jgi:hypothetical protein